MKALNFQMKFNGCNSNSESLLVNSAEGTFNFFVELVKNNNKAMTPYSKQVLLE